MLVCMTKRSKGNVFRIMQCHIKKYDAFDQITTSTELTVIYAKEYIVKITEEVKF